MKPFHCKIFENQTLSKIIDYYNELLQKYHVHFAGGSEEDYICEDDIDIVEVVIF